MERSTFSVHIQKRDVSYFYASARVALSDTKYVSPFFALFIESFEGRMIFWSRCIYNWEPYIPPFLVAGLEKNANKVLATIFDYRLSASSASSWDVGSAEADPKITSHKISKSSKKSHKYRKWVYLFMQHPLDSDCVQWIEVAILSEFSVQTNCRREAELFSQ